MTANLNCYNKGCGQTFDPHTNNEESCRHHPGHAVFHDAYKGWSCCNKKSVDFTEFLNIKGCTLAKHSNVRPIEPEKKEKEVVVEPDVVPKPKENKLPRPSFEANMIKLMPTVAVNFKQQIDSMPQPEVKRLQNLVEEISIGTKCKNSGCEAIYESKASNSLDCSHHPGVPIFHEGMKYWSCCQKKTSDFTAFMNQQGCETGHHRWTKEENTAEVKCRWDWHQTARDVVVSVYAKMYDYKKSFVSMNPIRLNVELLFPQQNNNKFIIDLELWGIVKIEGASVNMMGTKVEIVLPKAEPGSWSKLEIPKINNQKVEVIKDESLKPIDKEENNESDVDLDDLEPERGVPVKDVTNEDK